jgi:hypothetical protein
MSKEQAKSSALMMPAGHVAVRDEKANYAAGGGARYFNIASKEMGNGTPDYPDGDTHGVLQLYTPRREAENGFDAMVLARQAPDVLKGLAGRSLAWSDQSPDWIGYKLADGVEFDVGEGVKSSRPISNSNAPPGYDHVLSQRPKAERRVDGDRSSQAQWQVAEGRHDRRQQDQATAEGWHSMRTGVSHPRACPLLLYGPWCGAQQSTRALHPPRISIKVQRGVVVMGSGAEEEGWQGQSRRSSGGEADQVVTGVAHSQGPVDRSDPTCWR